MLPVPTRCLLTWRWVNLCNLQVRDEIRVTHLWVTTGNWLAEHGRLPTQRELTEACNCAGLDSRGRPITYGLYQGRSGPDFVLVAVGRDGILDSPVAEQVARAERNVAGEWDTDIVRTRERRIQWVK